MRQRGRNLAAAVIVAAAVAHAGCNSQSLGGASVPTGGLHPTAGSAGARGGGDTGGASPGLQGTAGLGGGGLGMGGLGAASGPGVGGGLGTGSAGDGGVTGAAGSGSGDGCPGVGYETNVVAPDILMVVSRAQSLSLGFTGQPCTSFDCMKGNQLYSAVDTVMTVDPDNNYGLLVFNAGGACDVPTAPAIGVGPGNRDPIVNALEMTTYGGASPMTGTIAAAVSYLQGLKDGSPRFILLATDGEATCPPGDTTGAMDDTSGAVAAIAAAAAQGVMTMVLGVTDPADAQAVAALNAMASAGEEQQTGAATAYYDGTTSAGLAALEQALSFQIDLGTDCTVPAPSGAPPGSRLTVTLTHDDGVQLVPYDPTRTSGWNYTDSTDGFIELDGTYCSQLHAPGRTDLELQFDCTPDAGAPPTP